MLLLRFVRKESTTEEAKQMVISKTFRQLLRDWSCGTPRDSSEFRIDEA